MKKSSPTAPGQPLFRYTLLCLGGLTLLNLLFSGSVVSFIGALVILIMVWGIHRGDYPLTRALGILLYVYAAVNLAVMALVLGSGASARISSLIWLGLYSLSLIAMGTILRSSAVQGFLQNATPPEEKKRKIHFFHGGWRDL